MGTFDRNVRAAARPRGIVLLVLTLLPALGRGEGGFDDCVLRLRAEAEQRGVTAQTAAAVLGAVRERPEVLEADRRQPEFIESFSTYLARRVTEQRIERGQELLREHAALLARLEKRYGVPGQYLIAFWGLETNYGRVLGRLPVFDSLATLACDTRRGDYFAAELMKALEIVERGDVAAPEMTGSWAGAMGHTQFMPSVYLENGVDGDGDGAVDLWGSVPDALASAASFLHGLGWTPGWRWGREVMLPSGFDYYSAGLDRSKTLAEWRAAGVRKTDGGPIDAADVQASLLLPAGHLGPAFLVYANFEAILRWNRSEHFGLAVGLLADRIAGAGSLRSPPPEEPPLSRESVEALQRALNLRGFDSGEPDGVAGSATRRAVREWQRANGVAADGHIGTELLRRLGIEQLAEKALAPP
ncbi:MAG TPA: lytic murein transglycosylase [Gammaproteobacteria bacterium]|nr:lytic murein transglycosylase [Gammaproteobacteria bacterium]